MKAKHKTLGYWRSAILSYYDLTAEEQVNTVSNYFNNTEQAQEDSFVVIPDHSPIPMSMFMKWDGIMFDGWLGTSAFSAYFIKMDRFGENATIVLRSY